MSGDYKLCGTRPTYDTDTWRTPILFYERLNKEFRFKLDAACNSSNCLAPSGLMRDFGVDSLSLNWRDYLDNPSDWIWLNPPFKTAGEWVRKASESECNICCLVQADTGTKWWHRFALKAYEIRFYEGRIRFDPPPGRAAPGSATKPSAVLIFCPAKRQVNSAPIHRYISRERK